MDEKKGNRSADQIVKVRLKDGHEQWILIHIEVQSTNEKDFSERMFQYFYRIYDAYAQEIVAMAVMTSPYRGNYSDKVKLQSVWGFPSSPTRDRCSSICPC